MNLPGVCSVVGVSVCDSIDSVVYLMGFFFCVSTCLIISGRVRAGEREGGGCGGGGGFGVPRGDCARKIRVIHLCLNVPACASVRETRVCLCVTDMCWVDARARFFCLFGYFF